MGPFMKGFGKTTRNMDLEGSSTQKETCIRVNGLMEYHMVRVNASTQMVLHTKGIGEIINLMDLAMNDMKMGLHFEGTLLQE